MLFLLERPYLLLATAIAVFVGIVARCLVQALVAERLGDRWARSSNRLTLDPRRHFEPFGVIAIVLSAIGWNKPVPLEEPRLRYGRKRYVVKVLAGPLTNLVLGVLAVVASVLVLSGQPEDVRISDHLPLLFLTAFAKINVELAVLALVPLPPLDGARLMWAFAPPTEGWRKARFHLEEQHWGLGILLLLLLPIFETVPMLRVVNAVALPLLNALYGLFDVSLRV